MTTIQHRPAQLHLWWYAAAAVLAGAVLTLLIATLQNAGPAAPGKQGIVTGQGGHYQPNKHACFAGRSGGNIDLVRARCSAGLP